VEGQLQWLQPEALWCTVDRMSELNPLGLDERDFFEGFPSTALRTDLYELTMSAAALKAGTAHKRATFELFGRKLPTGRRYGVVAGVQRAIDAVENFHFTDEQLDYLARQPMLSNELLEELRDFSFSGTLTGYPEGSLYFPYSPILRVEGTFLECVLLETVLLSIYNHDSAIASAASRMVQATRGKFGLIEMGSRRTHEDSAVAVARAAYIAGFQATSNIEAGLRYGIPITGTAAHAFTLSFGDEREAFKAQIDALGRNTTLLVDTYDIQQGIRNAVEVAGPELGGIRIDSGDLHEETVRARQLLDSLGATKTKIILSSDIDEYSLSEMVERGTPVDGAGAGTRVATGSGHPTCGMVYKLVEREAEDGTMVPVAKRAAGKKSLGGLKTPVRAIDGEGTYGREILFSRADGDILALDEFRETPLAFQQVPLFDPADPDVYDGSLEAAQDRLRSELAHLPEEALSVIAGDPLLEAQPYEAH